MLYEVITAENIIDTQVTRFMRWLKSLEAVPRIRALRETAYAVREQELERARRRLARGEDPQVVMARLAHALTNKLMHAPTTALRQAEHEDDTPLASLGKLLNLPEED